MTTAANQLDLSVLPPSLRREMRDFYLFLLERRNSTTKSSTPKVKSTFTDLCGSLTWKGDAVAVQRSMRDEW